MSSRSVQKTQIDKISGDTGDPLLYYRIKAPFRWPKELCDRYDRSIFHQNIKTHDTILYLHTALVRFGSVRHFIVMGNQNAFHTVREQF